MYRLACLVLLAAASTAHADPHQGLFVRLTPGIAGSAASTEENNTELDIRGGAGRLGIAVGWTVAPRLILTAELLGHAVLGPELEYKGTVTMTDDDVVWGVSYAGLGVNYYFPSNLYLSGSGGALVMTLETSDTKMTETDVGFGMKIGLGREWWVSPKVGLGVGIELLAGYVPDDEARWGVATFGLAFSATYN